MVGVAVHPPPGLFGRTSEPELRLGGLDEQPARALLATVTSGPLDESVRAGFSRRHTAIRWPCSSFTGAGAPPTWPAGSLFRTREICPGVQVQVPIRDRVRG
jgi:hypothetical protein